MCDCSELVECKAGDPEVAGFHLVKPKIMFVLLIQYTLRYICVKAGEFSWRN
jgi:hypothetical protein